MIDLNLSLGSNGEVKAPGYSGQLHLGYNRNRGIYRLNVTHSGEWEGLSIRALWRTGQGVLLDSLVQDGIAEVPALVTSEPGEGRLSFEGSDGSRTLTSADVRYSVAANSGGQPDDMPEPGTPAWEALIASMKEQTSGSSTSADLLTPEQFGAVGDGETDDYAALLAAMQAASTQKKPLNLTHGKTYLWTGGADIKELSDLYIEGNGAQILVKDNPVFFCQSTNTTVHNVHFVGHCAGGTMAMVEIFECTGFKLLDSILEWDLHDNIEEEHNILDIYRGNRDILIRGCTLKQLTGTKAGGIWIREGKKGFVGWNIRMEDCDIYKAGGDEVLAIWGWAGYLKDVTVTGCNFIEVDDPKYAARGKDPAWMVGLNATSEGDTIRFENCSIRTCRAGSTFRLVGKGNVTVDNCDIYNDSKNCNHNYPLLQWTSWNDPMDHCVIQNSRITLKGRAENRIAYRLPRCYNNQFVLDCEGKGFQTSGEIVGNTFTGTIGGQLAQDTANFSNNRIDVVTTNPNWQAGCLNILNNDISITVPNEAQGCNIISNQPDNSTFAGNKIKFMVKDSDVRTYGFGGGTHYVYNNQVYTNAPLKLEDSLGDVVFRKNNYINGLPEKSFTCTGISFDPAELTENYMKRKEFNAAVTPENTTDPIVYAISDPDNCLQILRYGAYKPVKDGKVSVKATCGSYDASQYITVELVPVACESLRLGRKALSCAKDGTSSLRAVYAPYWTTDTISWESSAPDIATVNANGIVTGKALGTAVITVRCGSLSDSCTVSVVEESELPVYVDGAWSLDALSAYIPLESIGTEHTLYVSVEADSTSLANGAGRPLFGTTMDGSDHLLSMRYMKDPQGYGTLRWTTSDSSSTFDAGEQQNIYSTRSVPMNATEGTLAGTRLIFTPEGVYNLTGALCWGTGTPTKATLNPYSGKVYFNVADTDGNPTSLTGYKIKNFILFANETITTEKEILQYRDSADIDIRFTEDGQAVNAGTAGAITILKKGEIPDTPVEPSGPTNSNPFPDIEAAYVLPDPKTFDPARQECIDTGVKLFESFDTKPEFTVLVEAQVGEDFSAGSTMQTLLHCMEESDPWPGLSIQVSGSELRFNLFGSNAKIGSVSDLKAGKKRFALRVQQGKLNGWKTDGGSAYWGFVASYDTAVDKSLILGAYQESDGTKGRFFDGTLSQCAVYKSALTDDKIDRWMKG